MKTNCWCNPKTAAAALLRVSLGVLMLTSGIPKLMGLGGFVNGYLIPAFEKTFLPGWMVAGYGYALPVAEAALGLLLILGVCRTCALLLNGLMLVSLAFGIEDVFHDGNIRFGRELAKSIHEGKSLVFHDEGKGVTSLSTAEAFE